MNALTDFHRQATITPAPAAAAVLARPGQSGFAILHGSLAPQGCVVRLDGFVHMAFDRTARVFGHTEAAQDAILGREVCDTDILVMLGASNEALAAISRALDVMGLDTVIVLTDSRIDSTAAGRVIGNVAPPASAGGPIGRVRDGDLIHIDIAERHIDLMTHDAAHAAQNNRPEKTKSFGALEKYARLVSSTPHDQ